MNLLGLFDGGAALKRSEELLDLMMIWVLIWNV